MQKKEVAVVTVVIGILVALLAIGPSIKNNNEYKKAIETMNSGDYQKAVYMFQALGDFNDSREKAEECIELRDSAIYKEAMEAIQHGDYEKARELLYDLTEKEYEDSEVQLEELKYNHNIKSIENAKVGDIITFGSYEQDDYSSNGPEDIEWIVLDKKDNKILVLSKHSIEMKEFNESGRTVEWAHCSLRKWLNNEFYDKSFTSKEKDRILTTDTQYTFKTSPLFYSKYLSYESEPTLDKLFLLSHNELNYYFHSREERYAVTTRFASRKGTEEEKIMGKSEWWLRDPSPLNENGKGTALVFDVDGTYYEGIGLPPICYGGVRPAMTIDVSGLSDDVFETNDVEIDNYVSSYPKIEINVEVDHFGKYSLQLPYTIKIKEGVVKIYSDAGDDNEYVGVIESPGTYTIVEEKILPNGDLWGKLKSGDGWIKVRETA